MPGRLLERWRLLLQLGHVPDVEASIKHIVMSTLSPGITPYKVPTALSPALLTNLRLNEQQVNRIESLCKQRARRVPLQYLVGHWDFRHLTLELCPPVLIPRPETELLVAHVLQSIHNANLLSPRVLEVGCGSGAICLSLLHELPSCSVVAIDCDQQAVDLTRRNATRLGLTSRLTVLHADACGFQDGAHGFDVIVSNPPYIPSSQLDQLEPEVKMFESHVALDGGWDGMNVISVLLKQARDWLHPNGSMWLEIDHSHQVGIQAFLQHEKIPLRPTFFLDQYMRNRFCHLQFAKPSK